MGSVPTWSLGGALCQPHPRPVRRARPSCPPWLSNEGRLQTDGDLRLSQNQPRVAGDARGAAPLRPRPVILPTARVSPKGQRGLTLPAETVPQTCWRSCLLTMDPHRCLQGESKGRRCILRQGTGVWGHRAWQTGTPRVPGRNLKDSSQNSVRHFTQGSPHQEATLWEPDPEETRPPPSRVCVQSGGTGHLLVTHSNANSH